MLRRHFQHLVPIQIEIESQPQIFRIDRLQMPQRQTDLRFALGVVIALAVLIAFVVSLHLLSA